VGRSRFALRVYPHWAIALERQEKLAEANRSLRKPEPVIEQGLC
jgi:hypothetical protein